MKNLVLAGLLCLALFLSVVLIAACGGDDDDDDNAGGDDDDNATGGDDCESLCERGLECFGEEYWEYTGVGSMEECVQQCEDDLAGAEPELAECVFACATEVGCDAWAECCSECAG